MPILDTRIYIRMTATPTLDEEGYANETCTRTGCPSLLMTQSVSITLTPRVSADSGIDKTTPTHAAIKYKSTGQQPSSRRRRPHWPRETKRPSFSKGLEGHTKPWDVEESLEESWEAGWLNWTSPAQKEQGGTRAKLSWLRRCTDPNVLLLGPLHARDQIARLESVFLPGGCVMDTREKESPLAYLRPECRGSARNPVLTRKGQEHPRLSLKEVNPRDPNGGNKPDWGAEQTQLALEKEQSGSGRFDRFSSRFTVVWIAKGPPSVMVVVVWYQWSRFDPYSPATIKQNRACPRIDPTGQVLGQTSPWWLQTPRRPPEVTMVVIY
ncbi:hypothetical protein CRG98_014968 [Punica granatum]|uniref:Uncharacterized protein n=1 Tax=Punica granatum TaxID=22663 RepID=A0A2I0K8W6_PUNGR|nr:hypothetical protein CRG98_014968 [Punica granatum]